MFWADFDAWKKIIQFVGSCDDDDNLGLLDLWDFEFKILTDGKGINLHIPLRICKFKIK